MNLTEHFTFEELTRTNTGLSNEPGELETRWLERLAQNVLEPIRSLLGCPLKINSGYRSEQVNARVGGAKTSQHVRGQAADFIPIGDAGIDECVHLIRMSGIPFDQLILEPSWIHVSTSDNPRRQVLKARKVDGVMRYEPM